MLNVILFTVLFVFLGTRNGRTLLYLSFRSALPKIPFPVRRFLCAHAHWMPLFVIRYLLSLATLPMPADRKWIHPLVSQQTRKGIWINPFVKNAKQAEETAPDQDLVILYFHGGGFAIGSPDMYMTAFKHIIHQLLQTHDMRASIFSVEYSLSPEHRWPKATHEAVDAYRYLIHHLGISPSKVVLAGDSAGGNLVATTLFALNNLKQQRSINQQQEKTPPLPLPTAAVLLSPWVDVTPLPSSSVYPMDSVSTGLLNMYNSLYLPKGQDPKDPMVSPLYATMTTALCPLFIAYGEHELIRPSIELFIEKLQQQKNHVTVLKGSKATHIWCVSDMVSASQKVFEQDLNVLVKWLAKKGM